MPTHEDSTSGVSFKSERIELGLEELILLGRIKTGTRLVASLMICYSFGDGS